MLVVSPYTQEGVIDDEFGEFSSPLRFVADNWGLDYLTERIATSHNYEHVFDFTQRPRPPDPGPKVKPTNRFYDFPEEFPGWPAELEPTEPKIRYP